MTYDQPTVHYVSINEAARHSENLASALSALGECIGETGRSSISTLSAARTVVLEATLARVPCPKRLLIEEVLAKGEATLEAETGFASEYATYLVRAVNGLKSALSLWA